MTLMDLLFQLERRGAAYDMAGIEALMPDVEAEYVAVLDFLASRAA